MVIFLLSPSCENSNCIVKKQTNRLTLYHINGKKDKNFQGTAKVLVVF